MVEWASEVRVELLRLVAPLLAIFCLSFGSFGLLGQIIPLRALSHFGVKSVSPLLGRAAISGLSQKLWTYC